MAWNRPTEKKVEKQGGGGNLRLLIGFAAIVGIGVAVFCFVMSGGKTSIPNDSTTRQSRIASAKPAKSTAADSASQTAASKANRGDSAAKKIDVLVGPEPTKIEKAKTPVKLPEPSMRTFSTSTEQVMGWVFSCEVGDMPMPCPEIGEEDMKNLASILISKNEIKKDDSESVAALKQTVDYAKKEMIEYIKEGGDPNQFLQYYHKQLMRAFEWRTEAIHQITEMSFDDKSLARDFLSKVNEKFAEEGIKQIEETIIDDDEE